MTHHEQDRNPYNLALELLTANGFGGMAEAIELLINEAMKIEREGYLGAGHYERSGDRRGYANGFKPKQVSTRIGKLSLQIPKVRDLEEGVEPFYPHALERGARSERALKLALAEMYVQGVSTRKVTEITRELCGLDVSSSQVSRLMAELDEKLEQWRARPLGEYPYILMDARYENVRHGGSVRRIALLYTAGIGYDGKRKVLGVSASLSEAEVHWREHFEKLIERGLRGVKLIVSDDHAGMRAAREALFHGVLWQRCQFHLQQNAQSYVPKISQREEVARDIRSIFNAADGHEAKRMLATVVSKWTEAAPALATWMEESIPEGLTVFALPAKHWRRMRTSNMLERLSRELKRRTRVATLFPNEASLLRLASAILAEVSEEWETGRIYLSMEPE
jgi:transposase-like protein